MSLLNHKFYSKSSDQEYELSLSAWGENTLIESELLSFQRPDEIIKQFNEKFHHYPKSISLFVEDSFSYGYKYGFNSIDSSFLLKLKTLKELIIPDSIENIDMTDDLLKLLKSNKTLIRGNFDSYAEKFASTYNLNFRPSDFVIAEFESSQLRESITLTLMFKRNGKVHIKESISSQGNSFGNTLGINVEIPLNKNFYNQTIEEIANNFNRELHDEIIKNGKLSTFLNKAKTHDYYKKSN